MPPTLKRRKVRRGTQNCWECRRRKIRCTYAVPTDSICDSCKSRQVKCVSQLFYEDATDGTRAEDPANQGQAVEALDLTTGNSPNARVLKPRARKGRSEPDSQDMSEPSGPDRMTLSVDAPTLSGAMDGPYTELHRDLLAVWPDPQDLDAILSLNISTAILYHGVICAPYSSFLTKDMPPAGDMLQPPSRGSHPVIVVRMLLLFAIYLQGVPRKDVKRLDTLMGGYVHSMSRLVDAARRVTSRDDLVGSLDGIECIMLESMYYNNAGNLRRAWITHRRAMTVAEMLRLDSNSSTVTRAPVLEPETTRRLDSTYMWYRLVITDRYLSLMLGLPQHSAENTSGTAESLESSTPIERLERMESIAGGLIIQRNRNSDYSPEKTHQIDKLLQEAAALMPARWWLAPDMTTIVGNSSEALGETLRLMNQFTHYHLLAQLHLPYLLRHPDGDRRYDYNKITTITASREILSRFASFRKSDSVAAYCRGIDFLAFIASTVLCLAHISSSRRQRLGVGSGLSFLVHQRLGDRGLLEQTLQCMEDMDQDTPGGDALSSKIAHVLRHLLAIEAKVAYGARYNATITPESNEPGEPGEVGSQDCRRETGTSTNEPLRIHIPHFGTVRLELSESQSPEDLTLEPQQSSSAEWSSARSVPHGSLAFSTGGDNHRAGVLTHTEAQASSPQQDAVDSTWSCLSSFFEPVQPSVENAVRVTTSPSALDDWALQGVDMALFDTLIRGAAEPGSQSMLANQTPDVVTKPQARKLGDAEVLFESWFAGA